MNIQEIKKLSVAKKIVLAQDIWESIDDSIELTDEIKAELDSRIERHQKGEGKYFTLEEAKEKWA
ncbi:MAG: addiction module protein, partial [Bacteroidota bacterium]